MEGGERGGELFGGAAFTHADWTVVEFARVPCCELQIYGQCYPILGEVTRACQLTSTSGAPRRRPIPLPGCSALLVQQGMVEELQQVDDVVGAASCPHLFQVVAQDVADAFARAA